jgi:hypothetical protein
LFHTRLVISYDVRCRSFEGCCKNSNDVGLFTPPLFSTTPTGSN